MARIVAVFGATGTQGGSVVAALQADGTFTPRAVTRNPTSEAAQKLKAQGVDVVQGDLWDKSSLVKALEGSEGVFGVTNTYDPTIMGEGKDIKGEIKQGRYLIDAANEAGVKFFIWSSLPDPIKQTNGKYTGIHHLNNKAEITEYLKKSGLPHVNLYTGWFAENIWTYGNLQPSPTGEGFNLYIPRYSPVSEQVILWVERDLGQAVLALLKNYNNPSYSSEIIGGDFYAVTQRINYLTFTGILAKALGKPVTFIAPESSGMKELDEMFDYQSEYGLYPDAPTLPDPRLIKYGAKFGTLEEFAQTKVKAKFA